MEIPLSTSTLLISILILLLCYLTLKRINHFRFFHTLGIPGPPPNIIWGNMNEIRGRNKTPMEAMAKWEKLYGPIYGYFVGLRPMLVIRDPKIIKEVLIKNTKAFADRPHLIMNVEPIKQTVVGLTGPRWQEVRAILSPTFSSAKIKQMSVFMTQSIKTTLAILDKKAGEGVDFNVYNLFQGLTCDVISGCALAMKVNSQLDNNDKFLNAIRGFLANAMNPFIKVALCFPFVASVAEWGLRTFGYSNEMTQMIMKSVKKAIEVRREEIQQLKGQGEGVNNNNNRHADVLQFMINTEEVCHAKKIKPLSDEEIVANAWVFILGGFETTASSLSFTSYVLSRDQTVQERLFKEVEGFIGPDEIPSYEQLQEMEYLDQVLCESLRLYPPVVSFVVRRVEEQVQLGQYNIPSGANVQIPIWQIHHDPNIWPEPFKFDPERFSQSNKKEHQPMAWIPFGAGPRTCIGARFAVLEIKLALAMIIRRFRMLPPDSLEKIKLIVPTVSIVPAQGIPLKFVSRMSK